MALKFPVHYQPRPYQAEAHHLMRNNRVSVIVFPRQTGKDVTGSMEQCHARLKTPKTTGVYISLDQPMIRDILWDKTYLDPVSGHYVQMMQDNVPADLVDWKDTFMLGRFHNKSRVKLQGYFQAGKDKNGVGTSFQDYTFTELALFTREDPIPRLMPIIMNESDEKRLMVLSTPRGKRNNPLWKLMESMRDAPDYGEMIRTIDDLNEIHRRHGLPPVLTDAQLEAARQHYSKRFGNDRMFEQEYYVSFEEMDAAAVYGKAYMDMEREGRITDFNLNTAHPVYVVFDIGSAGQHSDATAWIAFQWYNSRLFIYDAGEGHGKALPEYIDELRMKPWFPRLTRVVLPWDAEHHTAAINSTPADMVREKFPAVSVLAKSNKVWQLSVGRSADASEITDIQKTRMALYNTLIHKTNCQLLLESIENYKYDYDTRNQQWSSKPRHDRFSHLADALRYAVQSTSEIDFFGGTFEDASVVQGNKQYTQDYSTVWRKRR